MNKQKFKIHLDHLSPKDKEIAKKYYEISIYRIIEIDIMSFCKQHQKNITVSVNNIRYSDYLNQSCPCFFNYNDVWKNRIKYRKELADSDETRKCRKK